MANMVFVKPLSGLIVRDPVTRTPVPPEGQVVDLSARPGGTYWRRRIRDGSLVKATRPATTVQHQPHKDVVTDTEKIAKKGGGRQ